jgi:hypothetical protein
MHVALAGDARVWQGAPTCSRPPLCALVSIWNRVVFPLPNPCPSVYIENCIGCGLHFDARKQASRAPKSNKPKVVHNFSILHSVPVKVHILAGQHLQAGCLRQPKLAAVAAPNRHEDIAKTIVVLSARQADQRSLLCLVLRPDGHRDHPIDEGESRLIVKIILNTDCHSRDIYFECSSRF